MAASVLLERFGGVALGVAPKSSETDLVSEADRRAEAVITGLLTELRPADTLVAEEGSQVPGSSGRCWLVDPLDGTINFLYGHPEWSVSVCVEDRSGGLAGVVYDPCRDEMFRAQRGGGCTLNGRPIRATGAERLRTALVATGFGYEAEVRRRQSQTLERLIGDVRDIRRGGSAALDLAWVAAGRLDGYYERGAKPWDWAAGKLLVAEAGGATRTLPGEPEGLVAAGQTLLPHLYELVSASEQSAATDA